MKEVFITGASSGIGHALTESFLKRGDFVWAGVRKPEVMKDLQEKYPRLLRVLKLDVTSASDIESAWKMVSENKTSDQFVLINNAGIAVGGPIESLPSVEWKNLFDVNVLGLVAMTQKFLPRLRDTKGCIVNVGSISGRIATPYLAPYCSSKFAVRAISDSLRREMRPLGVKVVLIEPGPIKTAIWEKSIEHSQDLRKHISSEQMKIYGPAIEALNSAVTDVAKSAVPVSWVTDKVLQAVDSSNPKAYYLIGKGIHFQAFLAKHLPVKWLDALLALGFRFKRGSKKS
ncbi:SDR family oxidoreductase [Bdellovibrio bacteriovorus]|uniref:SDR family oxidoreductase n=1 Tax=Bdellovibrio bacteriovorus TaxID=959 RepID=UPI0035A99FA9